MLVYGVLSFFLRQGMPSSMCILFWLCERFEGFRQFLDALVIREEVSQMCVAQYIYKWDRSVIDKFKFKRTNSLLIIWKSWPERFFLNMKILTYTKIEHLSCQEQRPSLRVQYFSWSSLFFLLHLLLESIWTPWRGFSESPCCSHLTRANFRSISAIAQDRFSSNRRDLVRPMLPFLLASVWDICWGNLLTNECTLVGNLEPCHVDRAAQLSLSCFGLFEFKSMFLEFSTYSYQLVFHQEDKLLHPTFLWSTWPDLYRNKFCQEY